MIKKTLLKSWLLLLCMVVGVGSAWADGVSTLTFTAACNGSGTADDGAVWAVTSDGTESNFSANGIHYGTGKAEVQYIQLSTSDISGTITKVVVNASTAAGVTASVSVNVGGSAFGGSAQSVSTSPTEYTFVGSASGEIVVKLEKPSKAVKALYVLSVAVTYTTGGGATLENSDLSLTGAPIALTFDLYNDASAKVINYTSSSTGDVTIADSEYATFAIDKENKTITVTPTAVTPSAQTITVNQAADETYKTGSATFTLTVTDSTPIPTYTATFSVNGITSTQELVEGAAIVFPDDPADISGKTFVGWVTKAIDGTINDAPDFVTSATMGNADVTYYAVFAYASGSGSAEVVDELNRELTGVTGTSYSGWSGKTATSSAVYAGNSAGGNDAIQLRSNNNNSGIVTTTSGGKAKKVVITWYSGTAATRTVSIYGKNSAYTASSDLYSGTTQGTLLGELNIDNASEYTSELTINDEYEYIGIRSKSGAMYLEEVKITWSTGGGASYSDYCTTVVADSKQDAELSFAVTEVNANISDEFVAPTLNAAEGFNGTVEYESSDETVAQIMDSETGELRLLKGGTTTITATFAGNDDFRPGTASYTLNVTDDRIATTITVEDITLDIADIATLTQLNPVVKDAEDNIIDCTYEDFPPKVSYEIVSDESYLIGSIDNNSGEITLNEVVGTATLKAYYNAFNVSSTYKPSECTFTITVESTQTIAEARAQGTGSVTTKGVVTSCSGTTAYIQDTNAAICVYGSSLTVGDEVKVSGTLTDYNGLLEITSPTVTVLSQNNTVTPEVMTIADINASENQGWLVKIEDATVTAISSKNVTIKQDDNTIVVRFNNTSDITCAVDDVISLTGNIGCYNSAAQIANPTDVAVKVATPIFDPEAGEVAAGTTVTISTTTEDATIYYTTNGDEPTTESTEYTEPITINDDMTIKAIAVKDGMTNSSVATATYTINTTPFVTVAQTAVNVEAAGDEGTIEVTYNNMTQDEFVADVVYCDAEGNDAEYDWIIASINEQTNNIDYVISENTSTEARTAYIKVYALYDDDYFSDIITFTQAGMVVDYAMLPFEYDGNATGELPTGLTQEGLGTKTYANSPKIGFDTTGDKLVLKINEAPGSLFFDIKGNSFSEGTFTVQTSVDGVEYTELKAYTDLGATQTEIFNLNADVRYIKWVYTEKVSGNVALGNIKVSADAAVTIGAAKYATFSNNRATNFSETGITVYTAKVNGNYVTLTEVEDGIVPANTGVVLFSETADTYEVPFTTTENSLEDNDLLISDGTIAGDGSTIFALANKNQGVGFYRVANEVAVPAGTPYLTIEAAAREFFGFGSETTSINGALSIKNGASVDAPVYNLNGQRILKPAKGLYIVNGKKAVIK